ncbi:hypothetical protein QYE76_042978 [Lolium multiflorum]|uniref:CCHC-type domain-containing protein n=1 Tax=Lolium multiflorum TaxID=4521 RepID=A0AAD8TFU4_LOLMU|nr:hypothetical protein QYE76_042978 [Lolium multiflorum]
MLCHTCGGKGHFKKDCPNRKVMIINDDNEYETGDDADPDAPEDDDYDSDSFDAYPSEAQTIVVSQRVLNVQPSASTQRCNLFQTKALVGPDKACKWLSNNGEMKVSHMVRVDFEIGPYKDSIDFDVVPMTEFGDVFPEEVPAGLPPLRVLRDNQLYGNLEKCTFCKDKVIFLGYVVSKHGDAGWPLDTYASRPTSEAPTIIDATPWPRSPPSGPTTQTPAIYVKVNSFLSTLDLVNTLDGMLPHVGVLHVISDAGWPLDTYASRPTSEAPTIIDATPWPRSPPSGPTTQTPAIYVKVNSFLSTLDLVNTLDGMLPHVGVLHVIRYCLANMYSDEEDTEEYTEHFEEDASSSTADVEEHVELYTDYGSASIANMTDIEELYTDYGSESIANMDDIDELYIDTCSTSMDDMVEHHHDDDIDPTIVPNIFGIDTLLRAPQGAIMRVPMHKIIDITDIIWSIKSAPNMSHHLGMARTVIDSHHLMIVVDHHHLMVYIDILPHMIFDDTTQDMVMRQEDESLDMKTFLIRRLLPLAPPPQWPLPRHMPMDSDATSASNKATFHGNVPISYVSAKKLYFDELNAQVSKMPPLEDDLGGDGVEHGEHGILPSPTEAHGVEMVEHGKFPSTKEAHGDEQVEPTPICLIDELVPIPCEHESHLAHLSESDSELSDFHPICEFECFHLEDMSDTQSSTEDEFPLMETMYMVHEDDDISPCLLQDGHVDHMDPPTSTTPTSHESAYKGTRPTTSTATEHELTKRAIESYPNKDEIHVPTHGIHTKGYKSHRGTGEKELPWCKEERGRRRKEEKKEEEEEAGGRGPAGPEAGQTGPQAGQAGPRAGQTGPQTGSTPATTGIVPNRETFANFPVGGRLTGPCTRLPGLQPG